MTVWTTDAVKPNDRFSFWREVVCQTVLNVATEARPEKFWARLAAILAFCRQHLGNPDLPPQMVAAQFGISVRILHLRFERVSQTFFLG